MNTNTIYENVTAKVVAALEEGKIPWQRPWQEMITPRNLVSKRPYRGINVFLLSLGDHKSPYWASFKQINALGGKVKKGEKATTVVFWKPLVVDDKDNPGEKKKIFMLRYYNVFNVDQTEGIDPAKVPTHDHHEWDAIGHCENIIENMPQRPVITEGGDRAYYAPKLDIVNTPALNRFESPESYYATKFHELVHSTGHEDRLARKGVMEIDRFGDERYSKEELVAEMGSAILCSVAQIDKPVFDNTKAYIQHWLGVLKNDKKLLIQAAAQAQKAADFILGISFDNGDKESKERRDGISNEN